MGVQNRPYAGSWRLNNRQLVQYTPDCLVYLNGDTTVPGCSKCSGRLDLQQFITNVSVDGGVEPGNLTSTISMAVPREIGDSIFRDGRFLLTPGLEVHVYMRGYFPVEGLYQNREGAPGGISSVAGVDLSLLRVYPYYPTFHGVITQVDVDYSGGFYTASLSCASILHFWQYQPMSTAASYFGKRPTNSKLKMTLRGNVFNGMSPYGIMYTLFKDTAGSAGGVSYALQQKTNVGATSSIDPSKSLFSLNLLYWEKRFSTRMMNLRMHGANGDLYSTAQQAFLGRLKSGQAERLGSLQYRDTATLRQSSDLFQRSVALDLVKVDSKGRVRKGAGTSLASIVTNQQGKTMDINVAAMHAYVQDLGQFGDVNLFESTYENKLDVANRVREVTGWEFYQDVDGDLVFKPPFWNLDTSSSRVYRLEEIDLISLNESTKEPEATFITVKNSAFKNTGGTGLENEWGVKGDYIDYRLVAQYGWRPASYETSYLNNKTALFFMGVHQLDVLNSDINSASASIPLRPELRPGYPVYIPHLDSHYYVTGFQHSFQYGGQCTTNLTLTARRAKFYPPGYPEKRGVDAIDLGNMYLPQRPLEVQDQDGHPRLSGFPNVVMALDPDHINPLFFVVGSDIEDIGDARVIDNLLEMARSMGGVGGLVVERDEDQQGKYTGSKKVRLTINENNSVTLSPLDAEGKAQGGEVVSRDDLVAAGQRYDARRSGTKKGSKVKGGYLPAISSLQAKLNRARDAFQSVGAGTDISEADASVKAKLKKKEAKALAEIQKIEKQIEAENKKFAKDIDKPDISILLEIIGAIKDAYIKENPNLKNPNSTATILDLLSDQKSSFTSSQQPGFYRYYSCSHPDPKHQGQRQLQIDEFTGVRTTGAPVTSVKVPGFVKNPAGISGSSGPEAAIGQIEASRGLNVVQPGSNGTVRAVVTSEIQTVTFAKHEFDRTEDNTITVKNQTLSLPKELTAAVRDKLINIASQQQIQDATTLGELFQGEIERMSDEILSNSKAGENDKGAFQKALEQVYGKNRSYNPNKPEDGDPFSESYDPLNPFGKNLPYRNKATPFNDHGQFSRGRRLSDKQKIRQVAAAIVKVLVSRGISVLYVEEFDILVTQTVSPTEGELDTDYEEFFQRLNGMLSSVTGNTVLPATAQTSGKAKTKPGRGAKSKRSPFYTPVFPVSDANGYEVIGSFRLGRGLELESGGSFEAVQKLRDPLQFANLADVEAFVDSLVLQNGVPKTSKLNPEVAARIAATIGNLTDEQTKDLVLKAQNNDPEARGRVDSLISNYLMDDRDGVSKINPTNAAFRLSELNVHSDKKACDCRGAEADVLLQAFGEDGFVGVDPNLDAASAFVSDQMAKASRDWKASRDALRGQTVDANSGAPRLSEVFDSKKGGLGAFNEAGRQANRQVREARGGLSDALANFRDARDRARDS